jgi:hypothetical protein
MKPVLTLVKLIDKMLIMQFVVNEVRYTSHEDL